MAFADLNGHGAQEAVAESRKCTTTADFESLVIQLDEVNEGAIQNMVNKVGEEFFRVDYTANSAGVGHTSTSSSESTFCRIHYDLTC